MDMKLIIRVESDEDSGLFFAYEPFTGSYGTDKTAEKAIISLFEDMRHFREVLITNDISKYEISQLRLKYLNRLKSHGYLAKEEEN